LCYKRKAAKNPLTSKILIIVVLSLNIMQAMTDESIPFKNSALSKICFSISIVLFVYWFVGRAIDIYRFKIVGALFEILWLVMMLMFLVLPVLSLVFLIKEKFNFRSLYLYSLVITLATILMMIFI
jgi:hypothetical protein